MSKIIKTIYLESTATDITADMALINTYSLKKLTPEDVFIFSIVLCDNEIDRDFERFSDSCLSELAKLYVGKTGILNHEWNAGNQVARIYRTELERDGESLRLRAWAYIPRGESSADVIERIEGGMMKEVSVGVSIGRCECSICGHDMESPDCTHKKGREYDDNTCHGILSEARDAYEWSFVAVPAQRGAGVTKSVEDVGRALDLVLAADLDEYPDKRDALREKLAKPEPPGEYAPPHERDSATGKLAAFFTAYIGKYNTEE